jgi:hypothetical protein
VRAVRRQMQLKASDILEARRVGRSPEECSKILDGADVACWVFGANLRIVMSSIMCRRKGLMASSVMGMLLS